jgi:ChpA-C
MKTWVRKTLSVGVLAAGALLFAPGAAHAGVSQDSSDNNGILNGTQLVAPVSVPLNVVGNAIGVAGEANAAGAGQNWTEGGWGADQDSSDNNGIGNGTQVYLPITVPLNVVGNAVGVLGEANAAGAGVNGHSHGRKESTRLTEHGHPNQDSSDNNGILNGTQIYSPIDIPINICGTSLALLGEANAQAICANHGHGRNESGWVADQDSHDNNGILNGTQVFAPISLPVNLAGNAIGVLGEGNAAAAASNESGRGHRVGQDSSDNNGILNGTQIAAPIHVPVNICGNALGILGEANATAACGNGHGTGFGGNQGGHHGHHGNGGDNGDDYPSGGGNGHHDTDLMGDGGAQGAGAYGSNSNSSGGRSAAPEASAVDSLTQGVGGVGGANLGGLDLLNTLR